MSLGLGHVQFDPLAPGTLECFTLGRGYAKPPQCGARNHGRGCTRVHQGVHFLESLPGQVPDFDYCAEHAGSARHRQHSVDESANQISVRLHVFRLKEAVIEVGVEMLRRHQSRPQPVVVQFVGYPASDV